MQKMFINNNGGTMTDYYDNPAISQSKLKDLKRSPKHFWTMHVEGVEVIETDAMRFGKAVHMCLFEHQLFIQSYIVSPNFDKRTKDGKLAFAEFTANNLDKIIISAEDMAAVKSIRDAVLNKKTSRVLLNNGLPEHELYWTDTDTGISCKAKLDYLIEPCDQFPNGLIIDLKTTINAEPGEFAKSIYTFGYYNQLAFYCNAVKSIYQTSDYPTFIFIPVEKIAPFECSFLAGDDVMLDIGLKENRKLLNLYNYCIESGKWYGYEDKVQTIGLPNWAMNKFNLEE
ncbi:MAG: PD-(D/E)XK nuclease-like domain-containing protein [Burkholderiales bacterium]|nr:PD-(D/E)XK nuclease-like domain-containing protein [Burkholderiales bacterium]